MSEIRLTKHTPVGEEICDVLVEHAGDRLLDMIELSPDIEVGATICKDKQGLYIDKPILGKQLTLALQKVEGCPTGHRVGSVHTHPAIEPAIGMLQEKKELKEIPLMGVERLLYHSSADLHSEIDNSHPPKYSCVLGEQKELGPSIVCVEAGQTPKKAENMLDYMFYRVHKAREEENVRKLNYLENIYNDVAHEVLASLPQCQRSLRDIFTAPEETIKEFEKYRKAWK